jgi:hypothetical protein
MVFPAGSSLAGGARIESADGSRAASSGEGEGLVIEAVDEGAAEAATSSRDKASMGTSVTLSVAAGGEAEDGGLPAPAQRQFKLGERTTIFEDTYTIDYIEDMRLDEQGEPAPVVKGVAFGRWLDVAINESSEDRVDATVYFVRKEPINVAPSAEQPQLELPEANFNMVSRQVQLSRGASKQLRIRGGGGPIGVRLALPPR